MKKLVSIISLLVVGAVTAQAQYPLPETQILGNLTVPDDSVGIGTNTPTATLDVVGTLKLVDGNEGTDKVLTSDANGNATWEDAAGGAFTTTSNVTSNAEGDYATDDFVFGSPEVHGSQSSDDWSRFFFDKSKSAFRAGFRGTGSNFEDANIGSYSTAFGRNPESSGDYSFSAGLAPNATGDHSVAFGFSSDAEGDYSFAHGSNPRAAGYSSITFGNGTNALGDYSFSMGFASGALHDYSWAYGFNTIANAEHAIANGYAVEASGNYSVAFGDSTFAESFGETTFGLFNTTYSYTDSLDWHWSDRLFQIGNGTSDTARSNALTILKNGNFGLGTETPDTTLHVVGQFKYEDGSEVDGSVLTSDANGVATWQPSAQRVLQQGAGSTTTGTAWETLGSYTIPSNTLSDGSSLDLDFFTSGNVLNDSLLVLFGSDTALIARCGSGAYVETVQTFYESAGSISFGASRSSGSVAFGTEDNSTSIDVEIKAKSQTIGNQTLDFFRIKYFD